MHREFYLLYKVVVRESTKSTKARAAYDASARATEISPALNDYLKTDPHLQNRIRTNYRSIDYIHRWQDRRHNASLFAGSQSFVGLRCVDMELSKDSYSELGHIRFSRVQSLLEHLWINISVATQTTSLTLKRGDDGFQKKLMRGRRYIGMKLIRESETPKANCRRYFWKRGKENHRKQFCQSMA